MPRNNVDPYADLYPENKPAINDMSINNDHDPYADLYAQNKEQPTENNLLEYLKYVISNHTLTKIATKAIPTLAEDTLNAAGKAYEGTKEHGLGALKSLFIDRNPEAVMAASEGAVNIGRNLLNIPAGIPALMEHLGLEEPGTGKEFEKYTNKITIPDITEKFNKKFGIKLNPEQEYIKKTVENLPIILPTGRALLSTAKSISRPPINFAKNIIERPKIKQALAENEILSNEAKESEKLAKDEVERETGKRTSSALENKINQERQKLENLPQEEVSNLPVPSTEVSGAHLERAQNFHNQQQENLANIEEQIGRHLNAGAAHDVNAAEQILNAQEGPQVTEHGRNGQPYQVRRGGIRDQISQGYNNLTERLARQHVVIDNTPQIEQANRRLLELIRSGESHTPEAATLLSELDRLRGSRTLIPANEYLTTIRAAKDYAREARRRAFHPDMNAEARAHWERTYNDLDDAIEHLEENFNSSIPREDQETLRNLGRAWATQVKPLQRNNTYQTILYRGRIEGDIMRKLRGTDRGDVLMRGIITQNPQILRNVVGQRYSHQPHELHNAGQLENEYISQMPELQNMINQHGQQQRLIQHANQELHNAQTRHTRNLTQESKAQKESKAQRQRVNEVKKERTEREKNIKLFESQLHKLRAYAKSTNINLKNKLELEGKIKEVDKSLNRLKNTAYTVTGIAIGKNIITNLKKILKD